MLSQVLQEVSEERHTMKAKEHFEPNEDCIGQNKAKNPYYPKENLSDSCQRTSPGCLTIEHDMILQSTNVLDHI